MEWPSQRVPRGGIFQPAKVNYSPETRDFLKVLIDESKLTSFQRQKVNYSLRSGEPLPNLSSGKCSNNSNYPKVTVRPGSSKRRSRLTIVNSGAYEREKFIPLYPKVDREKAKQHLQDLMAYGRDAPPNPGKKKVKTPKADEKELPPENRFDQIMKEIKDREEWYKRMVELGEGPKYKVMIEQQIQAKLREMKSLKSSKDFMKK